MSDGCEFEQYTKKVAEFAALESGILTSSEKVSKHAGRG